jgi:hypothetical protein
VAVSIVVENISKDGKTDLDNSLAFSVENVGQVDADLFFDESEVLAQLPAGMNREFEFLGNKYSGQLAVRFREGADKDKRVTVIKRTLRC